MDTAGEMFGNFEFAFDEGFVDEEFGGDVGEFTLAPGRDLLLHGFEASLHPVEDVYKRQARGTCAFCQRAIRAGDFYKSSGALRAHDICIRAIAAELGGSR